MVVTAALSGRGGGWRAVSPPLVLPAPLRMMGPFTVGPLAGPRGKNCRTVLGESETVMPLAGASGSGHGGRSRLDVPSAGGAEAPGRHLGAAGTDQAAAAEGRAAADAGAATVVDRGAEPDRTGSGEPAWGWFGRPPRAVPPEREGPGPHQATGEAARVPPSCQDGDGRRVVAVVRPPSSAGTTAPAGTTAAGLPIRIPMTHLLSGVAETGHTATGSPGSVAAPSVPRSPASVGGRLSSYHGGVRQARAVSGDRRYDEDQEST